MQGKHFDRAWVLACDVMLVRDVMMMDGGYLRYMMLLLNGIPRGFFSMASSPFIYSPIGPMYRYPYDNNIKIKFDAILNTIWL